MERNSIAVRDFPRGCVKTPRGEQEKWNPPMEITARLPPRFDELSPRQQFLERRRLFHELLGLYYTSGTSRPDTKAMEHMIKIKADFKLNGVGDVPGVEVGDRFDYRAEMLVLGLHRARDAGIALVKSGVGSIACSVVESGGYDDNVDLGDVIEYSGQGGNGDHGVGNVGDQELRRGNMGLLKSVQVQNFIRVIRGRNGRRSLEEILRQRGQRCGGKYVYSGLFRAIKHKYKTGVNGNKVHIFTLVKIPTNGDLEIE